MEGYSWRGILFLIWLPFALFAAFRGISKVSKGLLHPDKSRPYIRKRTKLENRIKEKEAKEKK